MLARQHIDQAFLPEVNEGLRLRLGWVVTVADRGFSSRDNLAHLRRGWHYIAGEACVAAPLCR